MDVAALATGNAPRIGVDHNACRSGAVGLLILASLAAAAVGHGGHYRRIAEVCGALLVVAAVLLFGRYRSTALQPSRWAVVGIGVMIACTELTGILDSHLLRGGAGQSPGRTSRGRGWYRRAGRTVAAAAWLTSCWRSGCSWPAPRGSGWRSTLSRWRPPDGGCGRPLPR